MSSENALNLDGQTAIVTGAAAGIGAAVARALARAGAKVGVNYRSDPEPAESLVAAIGDAGGQALALQADVSREDEVKRMFDRFIDSYGRIDIVVANAGIQKDAALTDMSLADWNKVIEVNLSGQFLCLREAIRHFLAQGIAPHSKALGKVICMSSVHQPAGNRRSNAAAT